MAGIFKKLGLVGGLMGSMAFVGCGSMGMGRSNSETWTMNTAESVPAAIGKVKVANQKDGNTDVKVMVEHLAPADNVREQTTYVVWIKSDNGIPQNVGILQVGKDRKGSLETKTPFKEFTVMVTAETSPAATVPSGQTVLDTRVTMPS